MNQGVYLKKLNIDQDNTTIYCGGTKKQFNPNHFNGFIEMS